MYSYLKISLFGLLIISDGVQAASEFNTNFIQGKFNHSTVDDALNNGLNSKVIYAVSLNGRAQGNFYFTRKDGNLIFDESFLDTITPSLISDSARALRKDASLSPNSEEYSFTENTEAGTLDLWYRDELMGRNVDRYAGRELSPSINSTTLSYNLGGNYYKNDDSHDSTESIPFNGHLSSNFQDNIFNLDASSSDLTDESLDIDNISVTRLFQTLKSEVTVGETYTSTRYGENFSFTGAQVGYVTDLTSRRDQMYTPNIRGFATTNATVEVYQDQRLLFSKAVAAGNFVLNEIVGLANQTLRVVVKEANGEEKVFYYDNSVTPNLLTPGSIDYQINSGKYRFSKHDYGDNFVSGEFSFGTEYVTPSVNSIIAEDYQSLTFGAALPLQNLGAIGIAMSNSRYDQDDDTNVGQSYNINYSKYLNNGIDIQLAGYRYATSDYFEFNDAMDDKYSENDFAGTLRSRYTANISGREPMMDNQLSFNYLKEQYWGETASRSTYSFSYGGYLRWLSYTISLSRSYDEDTGDADNSMTVSLNIPIGNDYSSNIYTRYTNLDGENDDSSTSEVGFNGYAGDTTYNVGMTHESSGNGETVSGGLNHSGDYTSSQLYGSFSPDDHSANASVSGSLMLAQGQVLASSRQSETFAVAKVDSIDDASVNGVKTLDNGYALVALNDRYDPQDIRLDVSSLSNNIIADDTVINVRPRSGAVTLVEFKTKQVKYFNAILQDKKGEALGFGVDIVSNTGEHYFTGNNGRLFIRVKMSADTQSGPTTLTSADGCIYTVDLSAIKSKLDEDYIDLGTLQCQLSSKPTESNAQAIPHNE